MRDLHSFSIGTFGNTRNIQTSSSIQNRNHYDVLELRKDCSDKDIRDAFVRLSKENHPDSSQKCRASSEKFSSIVEAYKVLGKNDSRVAYDHSLEHNYSYDRAIRVNYDGEVFRPNKYGFPDFTQAPPKHYYGIRGVKKLPNRTILLLCLIWAGVGISAQYFAIKYTYYMLKHKLEEKSAEISKAHSELRREVEALGYQEQVDRMKARMENGKFQ